MASPNGAISSPSSSLGRQPYPDPSTITQSTAASAVKTRKKARKGQAMKQYKPQWYEKNEVYSYKTLYHKFGIRQMEIFLAGEGVDIERKFPRGTLTHFRVEGAKRVKTSRGDALVHECQKIQQRIINRKNAGHEVGPDVPPNLGADDYESEPESESESGSSTTEMGEEEEKEEKGPSGFSYRNSYMYWNVPHLRQYPDSVATQQAREDIKEIMSRVPLQEDQPSASTNSSDPRIFLQPQPQPPTFDESEPEWLVRDKNGAPKVSVRAQKLIRRCTQLKDLYINLRAQHGKKGHVCNAHKQHFANVRNNIWIDYNNNRSTLMYELSREVPWEYGVSGAAKATDLVVELFPVRI